MSVLKSLISKFIVPVLKGALVLIPIVLGYLHFFTSYSLGRVLILSKTFALKTLNMFISYVLAIYVALFERFFSKPDNPEQTGDVDNPEQTGDVDNPEQTGDVDNPEQTGDADNTDQTGDADNPERAADVSIIELTDDDFPIVVNKDPLPFFCRDRYSQPTFLNFKSLYPYLGEDETPTIISVIEPSHFYSRGKFRYQEKPPIMVDKDDTPFRIVSVNRNHSVPETDENAYTVVGNYDSDYRFNSFGDFTKEQCDNFDLMIFEVMTLSPYGFPSPFCQERREKYRELLRTQTKATGDEAENYFSLFACLRCRDIPMSPLINQYLHAQYSKCVNAKNSIPNFENNNHFSILCDNFSYLLSSHSSGKGSSKVSSVTSDNHISSIITSFDFFYNCFTMLCEFILSSYHSIPFFFIQNTLFVISFIFFILGLLLSIAFVTLLERRVIASVQRRKGPNVAGLYGFLQPIADGIKLLHKFFILPKKSRALVFYISPLLSFWCAIFLWFLMPFSLFSFLPEFSAFSLFSFISISSLSIHSFIFLQGSQSRFSLIGSKRAISQMISYDLGFSLVYLTVFSIHKTTSLSTIILDQSIGSNIFFLFPLWFLFLIVTLAELNRLPFDLVEEESVIVAGFATEYGGLLFAMFFLGEYGMMMVFSSISTFLFWGGLLTNSSFISPLFSFSFLVMFHMFFYILLRATLPRYRYDQLLKIGWKFVLPLCGFFCIFFLSLDLVIEFLVYFYIS